jgi:maltooligosyltrehalose trehalohydrolase
VNGWPRSPAPSELRVAAALLLTAPFTPLLFQGEEWAATTPFQYFTDHADASLGDAVREGRREEFAQFGWDPEDIPDPQDPETFERSRLCWAEAQASPHREILAWYRDLIALRRRLPCLSDSRLEHTQVVVDEARRAIAVRRGPVEVLVNQSPADARRFARPGCHLLVASEPEVRLEPGAVVVPPVAVAIVEVATVEAG